MTNPARVARSLVAVLASLALLAPAALLAAPGAQEDACLTCHRELDEDLDPAEQVTQRIAADIHFQRGLGCADCHGGDPTAQDDEDAAMWDAPDFRGAPTRQDLPGFCGRCHSDPAYMRSFDPGEQTDQESQYYTSRHGELLRQGEDRVAVCTDCHGVHGIFEVSDPRAPVYPLNLPATCARCHADAQYMADFDIPTNQFAEYEQSVHGVALFERHDLGAPVCNDCHGNHGAAPPGVESIAHVCGNCHVNNEELFRESHLKTVFVREGIALCIGCHNVHDIAKPTDELLAWDHEGVCLNCHDAADRAARDMAGTFYGIIDSLKIEIAAADSLVELAEQKGMEITELLFATEDAHKALVQTRTSIHSFSTDVVREHAVKGVDASQVAIAGAQQLLAVFQFRRRGLFAASLIMTFLILLIYLKIKQIERRDRQQDDSRR